MQTPDMQTPNVDVLLESFVVPRTAVEPVDRIVGLLTGTNEGDDNITQILDDLIAFTVQWTANYIRDSHANTE